MSKVELPNEKRVDGACVSVVDSAAALIKMPEGMVAEQRDGGRGLAARAGEKARAALVTAAEDEPCDAERRRGR